MTREWDLDRSGKRRASETITCTGTVFDKDEETDTAEVRLHLSNCHLTYAEGDYRNDPYPSVCASVRPKSCPRNSAYIFCRINLKYCRLLSYDRKMCMWFFNFVLAIFDAVMALADSNLVPQLQPHLRSN